MFDLLTLMTQGRDLKHTFYQGNGKDFVIVPIYCPLLAKRELEICSDKYFCIIEYLDIYKIFARCMVVIMSTGKEIEVWIFVR